MAKEAMTPSFVFGVVFDVAPEQAARPAPTVEKDSVIERLVRRGDNKRVVLVRFFFPSGAPVKRKSLESKISQARADIVSVIGADPALFRADMDEVIVHGRISRDAVLVRKLARSVMSSVGQ